MPPAVKEPTLSSLIETRQALLIRCISCDKFRVLGALEAVASYGGLIRFSELRSLMQARCGPHCDAIVEPSVRKPDELTIKHKGAQNG